jgi:dTDP-3-amino-3,4,6-trideoxy-alpha-D-glucose transaminase
MSANRRISSMSHPARIPFLDLAPEIESLRTEIDGAIARVLDSGRLLLGEELEGFEREFAEYNSSAHAVGVASGLAALTLMLQAFDIGPGDEVVVPANAYIATWLAVSHAGARPVPVEPDFHTRNIDISLLPEAVTKRTRAVLALHLYGAPCNMDALGDFCRKLGIPLLVDAAHSCGAAWKGSRSECLGDAAAFSFYPTKNLGALGDAGAVVTGDASVAEKIRLLRNYGMVDSCRHELKGVNARLEELHSAVLRMKLKYLDGWNRRRRQLASVYQDILGGVEGLTLQKPLPESTPVWHLFTVTVPRRDRTVALLSEQGIGTAVHYPVPPHLSGAYCNEPGGWPDLPVTESLSESILSLPLHPRLSEEETREVAHALVDALGTIP